MSGEVRVEVKLSKEMYEKALEKARDAGFEKLDEFLVFLIEQVVSESVETFTSEDEEKVKERLRALGYID